MLSEMDVEPKAKSKDHLFWNGKWKVVWVGLGRKSLGGAMLRALSVLIITAKMSIITVMS